MVDTASTVFRCNRLYNHVSTICVHVQYIPARIVRKHTPCSGVYTLVSIRIIGMPMYTHVLLCTHGNVIRQITKLLVRRYERDGFRKYDTGGWVECNVGPLCQSRSHATSTLHYITLHHITHHTTLHDHTPTYTALHYIALHLHCTTLH
jgi:hypothetical protein